ncbi:MAG: hypothetical protein JRJ76_15345 [Deltaproteobacteria bacterium]|nr:hypothetical protein [Deltaproteobacteria bacterium]
MGLSNRIKNIDPNQTGRMLKYAIGCLAFLMVLIVFSSASNVNNYYLYYRDGAVEIWKGRFSPTGKERLIMMPGLLEPKSTKDVYSKEEVFPIICNYYISKANTLLDVPGKPDFTGIKNYLNRALSYATTDALRQTVYARLNSIDVMVFIYKADVAASRRTMSGFAKALEYLAKASSLDPGEVEKALINQKIQLIKDTMADLKKK